MDKEEYIRQRLQSFEEINQKRKEAIIKQAEKKFEIDQKLNNRKQENISNAKSSTDIKVFLVRIEEDSELEKLFLEVSTADASLEIIGLKQSIDKKFSLNTYPSVVYTHKDNVINIDSRVEKDIILQNIESISKSIEETKIEIVEKDKNDQNQLNWGGTRSSSRNKKHVFQLSPMFFRRNGMPIDMVNMYENQSVFLMCNGPSMKEIDLSKFKKPGIFTFGINNGGHLIRPNIWTCVDDPTRFMRSIWEDPTITKIVPQAHFEKPLYDKSSDKILDKLVGECPSVIGYRRNEHFIAENFFYEDTINWGNHKDYGGGRSVMISSLRICHLLGFKNVYLVGCDFEMAEDKKYFFNEERTKGAINNNNNSYNLMTKFFQELKPFMEEIGFNVYNTNKNSKLKVFDFVDLDDVLEENYIDVSEDTYGMYADPKSKGKK